MTPIAQLLRLRASEAGSDTPPVTRVVADIAIITNPGSGFKPRTEMNGSQDSVQIQAMLDQIKATLEAPPPAPVAAKLPRSKKG